MAKAIYWAITDAEARKRGEQIGLDTLVVHPWQRHRNMLEVTQVTGGAWLSSARVVRCSVKSANERNPCP